MYLSTVLILYFEYFLMLQTTIGQALLISNKDLDLNNVRQTIVRMVAFAYHSPILDKDVFVSLALLEDNVKLG